MINYELRVPSWGQSTWRSAQHISGRDEEHAIIEWCRGWPSDPTVLDGLEVVLRDVSRPHEELTVYIDVIVAFSLGNFRRRVLP